MSLGSVVCSICPTNDPPWPSARRVRRVAIGLGATAVTRASCSRWVSSTPAAMKAARADERDRNRRAALWLAG